MKIDKIGGDRFYRLIKNWLVKFDFFKKLENSKKTKVYFKIFDQNEIQKFKVTHPTKFIEM
jgi:hypothetical protein